MKRKDTRNGKKNKKQNRGESEVMIDEDRPFQNLDHHHKIILQRSSI